MQGTRVSMAKLPNFSWWQRVAEHVQVRPRVSGSMTFSAQKKSDFNAHKIFLPEYSAKELCHTFYSVFLFHCLNLSLTTNKSLQMATAVNCQKQATADYSTANSKYKLA